MIAKAIELLADRVLAYNEEDLTNLLNHFKNRMEQWDPSPEWERAVIAYFMINGIRVKNALKLGRMRHPERNGCRPPLRLVKNS